MHMVHSHALHTNTHVRARSHTHTHTHTHTYTHTHTHTQTHINSSPYSKVARLHVLAVKRCQVLTTAVKVYTVTTLGGPAQHVGIAKLTAHYNWWNDRVVMISNCLQKIMDNLVLRMEEFKTGVFVWCASISTTQPAHIHTHTPHTQTTNTAQTTIKQPIQFT